MSIFKHFIQKINTLDIFQKDYPGINLEFLSYFKLKNYI